jgi:hypothetical protein
MESMNENPYQSPNKTQPPQRLKREWSWSIPVGRRIKYAVLLAMNLVGIYVAVNVLREYHHGEPKMWVGIVMAIGFWLGAGGSFVTMMGQYKVKQDNDENGDRALQGRKSKPFQFSMRRMFVLLTIFCVECGLWNLLDRCFTSQMRSGQTYVLLTAFGVGALIGAWYRKPVIGGLVGFGFIDLLKLSSAIFEGDISKVFN